MSRLDRFFANIGIIFFSSLAIIVLLELCSFTVVMLFYSLKIDDGRNPLQYADESIGSLYNTDDIIKYRAMLKENWDGRVREQKYEPLVEHSEPEFQGEFVNVAKQGYRHVKNQRDFFNEDYFNIFLFGGSTMFGYGVADEDTFASYLQEELISRYGENIAIYNFGAGYWYSSLERIRLEKFLTANIIPDMVIFMDGLNDFSLAKIPDESGYSDTIRTSIEAPKILLAINETYTAQLFLKVISRLTPNNASDSAAVATIEALIHRLEVNRKIVAKLADIFDFEAVFIQQPTPYYQFDESNRAVALSDSMKNQIFKVGDRIRRGYQMMEDNYYEGLYQDLNLMWLSDFSIRENQYIDYVHYSPAYNRAIAKKVATELKPKFTNSN